MTIPLTVFKDGPLPVSFSFIFMFSQYSNSKIKLKNLAASENLTPIVGAEIQNADQLTTTTAMFLNCYITLVWHVGRFPATYS